MESELASWVSPSALLIVSQGDPASSYTLPLIEQLWHLEVLEQPIFSFYMSTRQSNPDFTAAAEDTFLSFPGGELMLGGHDSSLFEGDSAYSPLVVSPTFSYDYPSEWLSTIQGVIINGNLLPGSKFDAVFDTETAR